MFVNIWCEKDTLYVVNYVVFVDGMANPRHHSLPSTAAHTNLKLIHHGPNLGSVHVTSWVPNLINNCCLLFFVGDNLLSSGRCYSEIIRNVLLLFPYHLSSEEALEAFTLLMNGIESNNLNWGNVFKVSCRGRMAAPTVVMGCQSRMTMMAILLKWSRNGRVEATQISVSVIAIWRNATRYTCRQL